MNILIANWTWYPSGGDWTYIDSICKIYEAKGHTIIPFSMQNEKNFPTPYSKYFVKNISYKAYYNGFSLLPGINAALKSVYSIEAKQKLKLLLSENKVDIAQLNNINNYLTPSIIPILAKAKIPITWRILDYRLICPNTTLYLNNNVCEKCFNHKYHNCILNKCKKNSLLASFLLAIESYTYHLLPYYKNIDTFLFQSEFTRDLFVKYGFDKTKSHIIENPYDCNDLHPVYQGKNYILYFGRLEKEKGIYTLLNAMKLIPDIDLKVVGNGTEYEYCQKYISDNSIANVSFLGPKWHSELEPIITDSEFIIVPSELNDPSPYVVLQAFSYGKPVIASKIGGLKDMIINNENGLFFNPGNPIDLAKKIAFLFANKNITKSMGFKARLILEEKYNPERYYKSTMGIFNNLITSKQNH